MEDFTRSKLGIQLFGERRAGFRQEGSHHSLVTALLNPPQGWQKKRGYKKKHDQEMVVLAAGTPKVQNFFGK